MIILEEQLTCSIDKTLRYSHRENNTEKVQPCGMFRNKKKFVSGNPDEKHISTFLCLKDKTYTMRMHMKDLQDLQMLLVRS
jgi:hypothetical protein